MKVLFFSRAYTTHDFRFLEGLSRNGHQMLFLTLDNNGVGTRALPDSVQRVHWPGIPTAWEGPATAAAWAPKLRAIIDEVRPDLVHAGPVQSCGLVAALTDFHPLMLMSWGSDILHDAERDELWRSSTRSALERADAFVCDCDAVRQKADLFAPLAGKIVAQFPWGIDLNRFKNVRGKNAERTFFLRRSMASSRDLAGWEGKFVIFSPRFWEKIYGIDVLLDAFHLACQENPDLRLILAGQGSLAGQIADFIARKSLADKVFLPGLLTQDEIPEYLRAADLYVSCSLCDGTSISLLEAMASELPAVVSDIPANREWVESGVNGWLAAPGDAAAFADVFLRAARANPDDLRRIGVHNRGVAEARANWPVNFQKLLSSYDEIGKSLKGQSY